MFDDTLKPLDNLLSETLDESLKGNPQAIDRWQNIIEANKESALLALKKINLILLNSDKDNSIARSYALYLKSTLYLYGRGLEQSNDKAIELLDEALSLGNHYAMTTRANIYIEKREKETDKIQRQAYLQKAYTLYNKAITLNNSHAMFNLGLIYYAAWSEKKDESYLKKTLNLYEQASALKNIEAINELAWLYESGEATPDKKPNYNEAAKLYEIAIQLNSVKASFHLAYLYEQGFEAPENKPNYSMARYYYKQAVKSGHAQAMYWLALMYEKGNGEINNIPNYPKAIKLYEQAITQYKIDGQLENVAICLVGRANLYYGGYGEPNGKPNYSKTIELLNEAIDHKDAQAMYFRGVMHEKGEGEDKNVLEAIRLYKEASKLGHKNAQEHLTLLQPNIESIFDEKTYNNSNVFHETDNEKLLTIITNIIGNIESSKDRTLTPSWGKTKIKLLKDCQTWLTTNKKTDDSISTQTMVSVLQAICEIKRNPLGIFSSLSSKELKAALEVNSHLSKYINTDRCFKGVLNDKTDINSLIEEAKIKNSQTASIP